MKPIYLHILLIFFFFTLLIFPSITLSGAISGLLLWYNIILPTLLPFIITTNLITATHSFTLISKILGGPLTWLFRTSKSGTFAVIIGFLCGFPMGAKVIADLYNENEIHKNEAQYLLSFCNNTSPMFIVSFLVTQVLTDTHLLFPTFFCLYGAPFLLSLATRNHYKTSRSNSSQSSHTTGMKTITMQSLDLSIMNGITLVVKIGGYVMLFSIIISLLNMFSHTVIPATSYVLPYLELTNGIKIFEQTKNIDLRFCQMIFITGFGGLCALAQTKCVIQNTDLSMGSYFIHKLLNGILATGLALLYLRFQ